MPTYIHLVRHAQGYHNLSLVNHNIPDPDLTPLGKEQCATLCRNFHFHDKITHLVASPMRRTLYTCLLSFEPAVSSGKKVMALPDLQEVSNLPCDIGSDPTKLHTEFDPLGSVDLSLVTEGWNDKSFASPYFPDMRKLESRAKAARRWLRDLVAKDGGDGERHIAVVTHGGFLHFLTQDWDGMRADVGTGWKNTEYRTYEFVDPTGEKDADARLRETKVSWRARRGSSTGLTETEQRELKCVVENKLRDEFGATAQEGEAEKRDDEAAVE
ncbi:histidine phosphatase superfamily [Apodospora peruviana]|uniref:Histidine phosphatase superfamily n=1 Tax=Apodospora peruviana TaxID=516989 RepID=A0AAE0I026_9PEZI|nr:histidine phosphatase superfamily [Apodospora peruviana]